MSDSAQPRDVAKVGGTIYDVIFSASSFINVHNELLNTVLPFLKASERKRMLVIGPGPIGSPYHRRPSELIDALSGEEQKVVLLDYNPKNIAQCFAEFCERGVIGESGLTPQIIVGNEKSYDDLLKTKKGILERKGIDFSDYLRQSGLDEKNVVSVRTDSDQEVRNLEGTITFMEHDLHDTLPNMGEFDVIDASYALHHISRYLQIIQARIGEVYDSLREGGLFHVGTGFADMTYSEKKIYSMGEIIRASADLDRLVVLDKRVPKRVYSVVFEAGKEPKVVDGEMPYDNKPVVIDNEGYVHIPKELAEGNTQLLQGTNYDIEEFKVVPLIDPRLREDSEGLIVPVLGFYLPTNVEIQNLEPAKVVTGELTEEAIENAKKLITSAVREDRYERHNAERGLEEFYMPKGVWMDLLSRFRSVDIRTPNSGGKGFQDLVNLVAYK